MLSVALINPTKKERKEDCLMWKVTYTSVAPFASLGWLYLVQGIPYGLQDKFIPIQLRSNGLDYSSTADGGAAAADGGAATADSGAATADSGAASADSGAATADSGAATADGGAAAADSGAVAADGGTASADGGATAAADHGTAAADGGAAAADSGATAADGGAAAADGAAISVFVSLLKVLLVPWIAKGLWAPIVEVWGGRHRWLVYSLLGLALSSYAGSYMAPDDVVGIGCVLLSLNVFSAVQDVAVDGLALHILPNNQLGLGNTLQVVLYKVGCLVGGAGLTHLLAVTNWPVTFTILAFLYFITAALSYSLRNKNFLIEPCCEPDTQIDRYIAGTFSKNDTLHHTKEVTCQGPICNVSQQIQGYSLVKQVFSILKEIIETTGTLWLSAYVLLYKMGERGAINNMPLFLLDKGLSKQSLAFWNGTVCQGLSILGSFYGGIILTKPNVNIKTVLIKHSNYRLAAIIIQYFVIVLLNNFEVFGNENIWIFHVIGIASLCSLSYSSGIISTASFTLMMRVSRECTTETQASHYSVLASVEIAGKLLFATAAGFIIDSVGMSWTFTLFIILCTFPVLVLTAMPDHLCHLKEE
ncbi:major facilitator superfamily domain-containing protein 3 isoform X3 [Cherax quadricarinatus]|uniref:major facilitator superfamily domain-containing protein 3 isoform X3 n=1 Tax=Cherax quadricarinatus TaxID=27406 RepID=UPI002377F0D3|nr:major facilitator superfamily domain-containing protein 3-like isoform X3 [Cherax quadricarinatus]